VSGERRVIEHPLYLDYSSQLVPPLKFLLQTAHSPVGVVERPSPGLIYSHTPWYTEVALELTGTDAIALLYILPKDDESSLLAACLDQAFEPFFRLLTGDDYGDAVTSLTARHWPEVYSMLLRSNKVPARERVLCNVATPGRVQWVVADHLVAPQLESIRHERLLDLIGTSARTLLRASNFAIELPGVIEVLGGPDGFTRRLNAVTGLLGATSSIGAALDGGVVADEVFGLAQAALDAVTNVQAIREEM